MGNIESCSCTEEVFRDKSHRNLRKRNKRKIKSNNQQAILETMNSLTHDEKRSCKQNSVLQLYAQRIKESVIEIEQKKLEDNSFLLERYKDKIEKIKAQKMERLRQQVKAVPILSSTLNSTIYQRRASKYDSTQYIDY